MYKIGTVTLDDDASERPAIFHRSLQTPESKLCFPLCSFVSDFLQAAWQVVNECSKKILIILVRLDDGVRATAQSASSGADRVHDPLISPWTKQIKRKERDYTWMIKIRMDKDETRGQM